VPGPVDTAVGLWIRLGTRQTRRRDITPRTSRRRALPRIPRVRWSYPLAPLLGGDRVQDVHPARPESRDQGGDQAHDRGAEEDRDQRGPGDLQDLQALQ